MRRRVWRTRFCWPQVSVLFRWVRCRLQLGRRWWGQRGWRIAGHSGLPVQGPGPRSLLIRFPRVGCRFWWTWSTFCSGHPGGFRRRWLPGARVSRCGRRRKHRWWWPGGCCSQPRCRCCRRCGSIPTCIFLVRSWSWRICFPQQAFPWPFCQISAPGRRYPGCRSCSGSSSEGCWHLWGLLVSSL